MKALTIFIVFTILILASVALAYAASFHTKSIDYISPNEFKRIIDESVYFENMNEQDLHARNSQSSQEYLSKYLNSYKAFTENDQKTIHTLVTKADRVLWREFPKLAKIPWRFAKVDVFIEDGYPHTLGDVIILSDKYLQSPQLSTLIHEKVHILQRKDPVWTDIIIKKWGFREYNIPSSVPKRNNPDISLKHYGKSNGPIVQVYTSERPTSLSQSVPRLITKNKISNVSQDEIGIPDYIRQYEHPYEIMACMVPELLLKRQTPSTEMENILVSNFR